MNSWRYLWLGPPSSGVVAIRYTLTVSRMTLYFFSRNGQEIKAINAIIKAYAESISRERARRSTNLTAQHIYSNWPTRGQHRTGGERLTSTTALFCINVDVCKATATIHCSIQYNKLQQLAHRINRERDSALIDIHAGCRSSHCDWRI